MLKTKMRKRNNSKCKADTNTTDHSVAADLALELVHELMHYFDPRNHDYIDAIQSDGTRARGLEFHRLLSSKGEFGIVTFSHKRVELATSRDEVDYRPTEVLRRFQYRNSRLLRCIAKELSLVGIEVPKHLSQEIDDMQKELDKSARFDSV